MEREAGGFPQLLVSQVGALKPTAPMSVWAEGGRFLRPRRAEREGAGWKGTQRVFLSCSSRERGSLLAGSGLKGAVLSRRMWAEQAA
ncbi:MAG: hypothetical protein QXQ66_09455 [Candidatus Hadarchaeum sp.]|uniref:hypothetical protein n=1 Tax=Candidatus Hadarchaeum sp. TaxID=2883567 RepID=UPI00318026C0